jgi:hypothetical protein
MLTFCSRKTVLAEVLVLFSLHVMQTVGRVFPSVVLILHFKGMVIMFHSSSLSKVFVLFLNQLPGSKMQFIP